MRVVYILWLRQIKRYVRSRSRVVGAIAQPLLFLLALGYGLGAVFKAAGRGDYLQFLVPGIMAQTVLFSSMFYGAMIIYDRQFGFLKETMVAPVSRLKIMLGGALGGATTSVFQGALVFFIALALGFHPLHWVMTLVALAFMILLAIAITSFSSGLGSFVQDMQGFQAINQFLVFPLYFLSGALYPLDNVPTWLRLIAEVNPISYTVDAMRWSIIGTSKFGIGKDLIALAITTIVLITFGAIRFRHIEA
ncbi:ABC transporter permease [Patescibacteria group bacterium]|jgi:ABC-2 type transport system permease protein|nr:ABC transporter permease [Patescibacteria group bacterium]